MRDVPIDEQACVPYTARPGQLLGKKEQDGRLVARHLGRLDLREQLGGRVRMVAMRDGLARKPRDGRSLTSCLHPIRRRRRDLLGKALGFTRGLAKSPSTSAAYAAAQCQPEPRISKAARRPIDSLSAAPIRSTKRDGQTARRLVGERADAGGFQESIVVATGVEGVLGGGDERRRRAFALSAGGAIQPRYYSSGTHAPDVCIAAHRVQRMIGRIEVVQAVVRERDVQTNFRADGTVGRRGVAPDVEQQFETDRQIAAANIAIPMSMRMAIASSVPRGIRDASRLGSAASSALSIA